MTVSPFLEPIIAPLDAFPLEQGKVGNTILRGLTPAAFACLKPHLHHVDLKKGAVLQARQKTVEHIDFIEQGLVSLRALAPSDSFEIAMVGRHGMVGVSALLGQRMPSHHAVVTVPGRALRIYTEDLQGLFRDRPDIRERLLHHVCPVFIHSAQSGLCGVHHAPAQRLASWLCLACDALDDDFVPLAEDQFLVTFGRNAEIADALDRFATKALVRKTRAGVSIGDRALLARQACDCLAIVTQAYKQARRL